MTKFLLSGLVADLGIRGTVYVHGSPRLRLLLYVIVAVSWPGSISRNFIAHFELR